jgi:hypothetical protein
MTSVGLTAVQRSVRQLTWLVALSLALSLVQFVLLAGLVGRLP